MRAAIIVVTLALGGCYDFHALGDHDAGVVTIPADAAAGCSSASDCPQGSSCVANGCVAAPTAASCAAHKLARPDAGDGLYWLATPDAGPPELVYCDMRLATPAVLCSKDKLTRSGQTRDGSNLPVTFVSQFTDDSGSACQVWALQSGKYPLGVVPKDMGIALDTCQTIGFAADDNLGSGCAFGSGSGYSNCGYTTSGYLCYGHTCTNCDMGSGSWQQYKLMGPFTTGLALSSVDGSKAATCQTAH